MPTPSGQEIRRAADRLSMNKELVLAFLKMAFADRKAKEAMAKFTGPYKQHNPTVADGAEGVIAFAETLGRQFPQMSYEVKRAFQDGDHVIVHAHLKMQPKDRGMAVVDIFRLENSKIVEHWDVMQPVPEKAANDNTMF